MPGTTSAAQNELTSWEPTAHPRVNSKGYAGRVAVRLSPLVTCGKCLRPRLLPGLDEGPHSPHLVSRAERWVLIDCVGDEVHPA